MARRTNIYEVITNICLTFAFIVMFTFLLGIIYLSFNSDNLTGYQQVNEEWKNIPPNGRLKLWSGWDRSHKYTVTYDSYDMHDAYIWSYVKVYFESMDGTAFPWWQFWKMFYYDNVWTVLENKTNDTIVVSYNRVTNY